MVEKLTGINEHSPVDVVIKFVECYGEEAHQLPAEEHLAPHRLYCGRMGIRDDDPTFGELRMVVMEYVDGETLHKVKRVPPSAKGKVAHALQILHDRDCIFVDLRRQDVTIRRNEQVKQDWCCNCRKVTQDSPKT